MPEPSRGDSDGQSLRRSDGGSQQGIPELSRGDSNGQERTTGTGYAQRLAASGAREAEELCALISWLRRPAGRRHSGRTVTYHGRHVGHNVLFLLILYLYQLDISFVEI